MIRKTGDHYIKKNYAKINLLSPFRSFINFIFEIPFPVSIFFTSKGCWFNPTSNSICPSSFKILSKIYQNFLEYSQNRFGKLDIIQEPEMWALCTNKDNWKSVIHNHVNTSTINAVYYLNIPQVNFKNVGDIKLLHENKWYNYTPSENELIIFPNYLTHDTEYNKTDDFRVSINMEIKCNNDINWNL